MTKKTGLIIMGVAAVMTVVGGAIAMKKPKVEPTDKEKATEEESSSEKSEETEKIIEDINIVLNKYKNKKSEEVK